MNRLLTESDIEDLEAMIKGSTLNYLEFNNPLVKKAGHNYSDQYGKTSWSNLNALTVDELWKLRIICKDSWEMKDNALKEYGKEYFKNLLKHEHPNMKLGNTLTIGIQFLNEECEVETTITETIKKEEL